MTTRIQVRRGSTSDWNTSNPVLSTGEIGFNTTLGAIKIGDGVSTWSLLDYLPTMADLTPAEVGAIALTEKGAANGVAELDASQNVLTKTGVVFEGGTANEFETTLLVTDPTADRTITLPNATGTVVLTSDLSSYATLSGSETLTNKTLGSGSALGANLSAATFLITNLGTPSASTDAATKQYVDDVAQGLHIHPSCVAATTANLNATYSNGSSGIGATLTNAGALAAFSVDGVSPAQDARILVKNQTSQLQNGIYTLTTVGSGSVAWVLTRATDMNESVEIDGGDFVFVTGGTVGDNTGWVQVETGVTVGTSSIVFTQFSGAGTYLAGNGLSLTGNTFSINTAITADLSTSQTLTNKTLTSPVISSINNTGTLTLPTSTDTLVGRATTDTLTNKTINGTNNTISNISLTSAVTGTLPVTNGGTGITSFGAGIATFLGTPSSANLASAITDETGTGSLVFGTTPTLSTPVINNPRWGYTTTATAGGTTTLTNTSNFIQIFTGSSNQTVVMPVTSTLAAGQSWEIENNSTGTLTVNSSGGNLIVSINPGHSYSLTCIGTTLTTAADWNAEWNGSSTITGTGANVLAASPTLSGTPLSTTAAADTNTTQIATTAYVIGQASSTTPSNIGTAAVGTSLRYARADHVHSTTGLGLTASGLNQFASTTSAQLAGVISDETGSGALVFGTSPTIATPTLTLATSSSTTDARLSWDTTNKKIQVGNGTAALDFASSTLVTNAQTGTTYTFVLADKDKMVEFNNAAAIAVSIPTNASVAYPVGTQINILQTGAGQVTIAAATPATTTVNGTPGLKLRAQWSSATLIKRATDTWVAIGDLSA